MHVPATLDAVEFGRNELSSFILPVVHLIAMRAAELDGVGQEIEIRREERAVALGTFPGCQMPEQVVALRTAHRVNSRSQRPR